jgi:hypothetical protein
MTEINLKRTTVRLLYALALVGCVGLIAASLQTGCGSPATDLNNSPVTPDCETDADCVDQGELCSAYKVCLPRANGLVALGIELSPPPEINADSGMQLTQFEVPPWELYYGADGLVRISYPEAVLMSGALRVIDDGRPLEAMQATVTTTRDSRLPGRPKVVTSKTISALRTYVRPSDEDVESNPDFTMMLPGGVAHTIRTAPLSPYDEAYYPESREETLDSDSAMIFMFGEADTTDYLSGVVVDALGAGVGAVKVRAVDEVSGHYVSTLGTTDERGEFILSVPRGLRSYTLTFSPSADNQWVPETTHEMVQCCEHDGNTIDSPQDVGEFMLPAFPDPQTFQFAIEGIWTSGMQDPVSEVTVSFETTVGQPGGVTGKYVTTATSDDAGVVTVDLVPGDMSENRMYKLTIVTSPTSEFASDVRSDFAVGPNGGAGEIIVLDPRVPFTGHVSADSPSLESITVKARRNDDSYSELSGVLLSTVTDTEGRFNLLLDPGMYTLELQPPTSIPLPRWAVDVPEFVQLDGNEPAWSDLIISIPSAAVLQVQVESESGEFLLENVAVAVYLIDPACAEQLGENCDYSAVLLGEAVTDANGQARLIVPQP